MTRKPKRPHNPATERRQAFEAIGLDGDAASLTQQQDVQIVRAGQVRDGEGHTVNNDVARRLDAFEALRESMQREPYTGCYDAARRLERDVLIALGQHDHGRAPDRVDCEQAAFNRVDTMIAASQRLELLRNSMASRDWVLLNELIYPTRARETWRDIVAYVTGERNANAQGAAVRAACVNLRDAYRGWDEEHTRRAKVAA